MFATQDCASRFEVEISGWDVREDFFVENSFAIWHGAGEKTVFVRHPIREGSIVFVRLCESLGRRETYPVAYRAGKVSIVDARGIRAVKLQPTTSLAGSVQPRPVQL